MGVDNISELLGDQPSIDDDSQDVSDVQGGAIGQDSYDGGEPSASDGQEQSRQKTKVPLSALQEERTRRQELQDQLKSQQENTRRMEERFTQMMQLVQNQQAQGGQQEPAQQLPAFLDDPEGHINGLKAQVEAELAQLRQFQQQAQQQQYVAYQGQQLAHQVAAAEETFRAVTPDYNDAAKFFMDRKTLEYTALGADPIAVQQAVQRDYQGIAVGAGNSGRNPAEVLYTLAKAMGYSPRQGQSAVKHAKPAPSSLSNMGGAPRAPDETGGVTLESVANMTDAEFDKFWKQMERGSKQRPTF